MKIVPSGRNPERPADEPVDKRRMKLPDRLRLRRDECDPAEHAHRPQSNDEWMELEANHSQSVHRAARRARRQARGRCGEHDHDGRGARPVAGGAEAIEQHGPGQSRKNVDSGHRQVDSAGDDHDGRTDRHDGEERGVFSERQQAVDVQEFVADDEILLARRRIAQPSFGRAAEEGEQAAQQQDHADQPQFLYAGPAPHAWFRREGRLRL